MKKWLLVFILTGFIIFPLNAQIANNGNITMTLLFRNSKFFGYYLPLDFVEAFETSKDWYTSRKYIKESEYLYISIDKHGICAKEPDPPGTEGISEKYFNNLNGIENFHYEIKGNNDILIFKNNGKKYKKISDSFEFHTLALNNYIGRIVLKDFILSGELILDNDIIIIPVLDFGKFRIDTWDDFSETKATLYIYGFNNSWWLDMDVKGDVITMYTYATWIGNNRKGKSVFWCNR